MATKISRGNGKDHNRMFSVTVKGRQRLFDDESEARKYYSDAKQHAGANDKITFRKLDRFQATIEKNKLKFYHA